PLDSETFSVITEDGMSLFGTGATPALVGTKSANMAAKMMARGLV
ncbi:hypothetical protein LCGC14_2607680, partial [marine sediment metagenome]